jgi:hypothetical protein
MVHWDLYWHKSNSNWDNTIPADQMHPRECSHRKPNSAETKTEVRTPADLQNNVSKTFINRKGSNIFKPNQCKHKKQRNISLVLNLVKWLLKVSSTYRKKKHSNESGIRWQMDDHEHVVCSQHKQQSIYTERERLVAMVWYIRPFLTSQQVAVPQVPPSVSPAPEIPRKLGKTSR